MKHWFASIVILFSCLALAQADESRRGFISKTYKGDKGESKYAVFVPLDYTDAKEYPLILFLHGSGERGSDGEAQVKQGIGSAIKFKGNEKKFPFIVVFPQAAAGGNWRAGGADAERALAILAEVQKTYKVDSKRVYLTGLSMGGFGTWSLAAAHPDKWAAIVPICGGGDPKTAAKIKDIPCWCFVGDKDAPFLLEGCRSMIKALKEAGAEPRYSEFPYVGHNSWDCAYVTPELYPWLLSHKLK
jgi:predicted peptidase